MYSPHVSCFSLYGEFVDDAVLDFYTLQPSHYVFLGKRVKKITLYFTNGYLIKKRYSFDQDIFINPTFMIASGKKQEFERGTDLLIKYKGRKFRYERRDAFHLVEEL
jgi:hypothetical protein